MNKYKHIIIDGITYGLLLSCFIWLVFYFKLKIEIFYRESESIPGFSICYIDRSLNFFVLAIMAIISSVLARVIVDKFNKDQRNFVYWLKNTTIMFVIFYAISLFLEIYLLTFGNCFSCSLRDSIDIKLWLLLLLLFALFTPIYVYVKKLVWNNTVYK